jgi:predicted glycogen debranching enzyme
MAVRREWLVTNGIGGYASGTVAGLLTRRYHGLLIAALKPPLGRTLLLSKLDEHARYDNQRFDLFTNQWKHGAAPFEPPGFYHLERFHLEGATPVWSYALADAHLEKRVWMQSGANTTYVRYTLRHATRPLELELKALVNYRDYHANTHAGDWQMQITPVAQGVWIEPFSGATPFFLLSDHARAEAAHDWYRNYFLAIESARGLDSLEDHLYAVRFLATLQPGESVTLLASTESAPMLDGEAAYAQRRAYERQLLVQSGKTAAPDWVQQLVLAADQFIVYRAVERAAGEPSHGRSIIAGYHWFGDWGRDTMISLPGLTLTTGRHAEAAQILRTFAHYVDQGMLPNRFPDQGERPEYNTVDATLWYIQAIRSYYQATGDRERLIELFPTLQEIIAWHRQGTRHHIHVDPQDGLLYAGEPGVQLTWMDARVGDWVVTPRIGKAVEINALWYNALRAMAEFARALELPADPYILWANQVQQSFARFWNAQLGYCYDVLDTPNGDDAALRPNQLFAISLPDSPLEPAQQQAVVDCCGRYLLTSLGLRSLAPGDPAYRGGYGGAPHERDSIYHQGTAWGWLIGAFAEAHWRVYGDAAFVQRLLQPFAHHLADYGMGSISELAHGDPPHLPDGCIAQAWSVAEVLRIWQRVLGNA